MLTHVALHLRLVTCFHPHLYGCPELERVLDLGDLKEILVIWDTQGPHAILVFPFFEVALKCSSAPVALPATNLTLELLHATGLLSGAWPLSQT